MALMVMAILIGVYSFIRNAHANAQTFDTKQGCFYFCDGRYRQSLNAAFNETAGADGQTCDHATRCEFDGIKLRPGNRVVAYKVERHTNCESQKKEIECKKDGTFDDPAYPHSYCMPRDSTETGIIEKYHP